MSFESYIRLYHPNIDPNTLETTASKGYWRVKGGCPGGAQCVHAFRGALGAFDGTVELTVSYAEHGVRDGQGRFVRPHREWERQRELGL